ncbi:IS3 family transposase [Brachybacterium sp. AOP25-B2-12]|uniref:IS3 family transposase n=1 Tax=Brachybacterium sp. AOP25-B2-12 TaxID=3457710 RepID=UPI0040339B35
MEYIDQHEHEFGVEPICRMLTAAGTQIAPSMYDAFTTRPPSKRSLRDEELLAEIGRVHSANVGIDGAKTVHAQLRREGAVVARRTVERLLRVAGLRGISRPEGPRTTIPRRGPESHLDLVERDVTAPAPNQLRVAGIPSCRTFAGWRYAASVIDVVSRRVVGWQLSTSLWTGLTLDALEMGIWTRDHAGQAVTGLTHHGDKGVQDVAISYTERRAEAGTIAAVGSTGDPYDDALAEAFHAPCTAELVRHHGPWKNIDDLEIAAAEYIDWFDHRRMHGEIGMIPPVELEDTYHHNHPAPAPADAALASL